jgi:hypothetical protein
MVHGTRYWEGSQATSKGSTSCLQGNTRLPTALSCPHRRSRNHPSGGIEWWKQRHQTGPQMDVARGNQTIPKPGGSHHGGRLYRRSRHTKTKHYRLYSRGVDGASVFGLLCRHYIHGPRHRFEGNLGYFGVDSSATKCVEGREEKLGVACPNDSFDEHVSSKEDAFSPKPSNPLTADSHSLMKATLFHRISEMNSF